MDLSNLQSLLAQVGHVEISFAGGHLPGSCIIRADGREIRNVVRLELVLDAQLDESSLTLELDPAIPMF